LSREFAKLRNNSNQSTPIFMAHGTQDPVVPYMLGDETRALMQSAGYAVEWHSYPMPHSLCADEVADLHAFLKRVTVA
jgi:phospholipase/carboxylesterase